MPEFFCEWLNIWRDGKYCAKSLEACRDCSEINMDWGIRFRWASNPGRKFRANDSEVQDGGLMQRKVLCQKSEAKTGKTF